MQRPWQCVEVLQLHAFFCFCRVFFPFSALSNHSHEPWSVHLTAWSFFTLTLKNYQVPTTFLHLLSSSISHRCDDSLIWMPSLYCAGMRRVKISVISIITSTQCVLRVRSLLRNVIWMFEESEMIQFVQRRLSLVSSFPCKHASYKLSTMLFRASICFRIVISISFFACISHDFYFILLFFHRLYLCRFQCAFS